MSRTTMPAAEWLSARQAALRSGLTLMGLLKQAAIGKVRTRALPGENLKYSAADIEHLAAAGKPKRK
jgi:hypothetical protein